MLDSHWYVRRKTEQSPVCGARSPLANVVTLRKQSLTSLQKHGATKMFFSTPGMSQPDNLAPKS